MATTFLATPNAAQLAGAERFLDEIFVALRRTLATCLTCRRTLEALRAPDADGRADMGGEDFTSESLARAAVYGSR